jgi:hypothetical protein
MAHLMQAATQRVKPNIGVDNNDSNNTGNYELSMSLSPRYATRTWKAEEQLVEMSSAIGAEDSSILQYQEGKAIWEKTDAVSHGSGYPVADNPYNHFYVVGAAEFSRLEDVEGFVYDLIYVDDSWCRIFISDAATWDTSVTSAKEIQVPINWTSSDLDFHLRQGSHESLSGKYLWVVDNDDNKVLIGRWS